MGKLIFITGGVRSGKSSYAEGLAAGLRKGNEELVYLACGVNTDQEMERRILKHQEDRAFATENWITMECPRSIGDALDSIPHHAIVLLDCLTTLLTNEMFAAEKMDDRGVEKKIFQSIIAVLDRAQVLIVVSNEVFFDLPINSGDILRFQRTLGLLHNRMVEESITAIDMSVGIPVVKKGMAPG